jgi:hypothetical protein
MWSSRHYHESRFRRPNSYRDPLRPRRGFHARLETLEHRTVLSTLTVLSNLNSGAGSLRDTIAAASSGDTIVFAHSLKHKTITLTSGELAVTKSLDIEGPGAKNLAISSNAASRVFDISSGVTVTLAGLTITDGLADHGGGILNGANAKLTLSHDTLSQDQAVGGLGGGAIFNDAGAGLSVTDCSLTNNQATTGVNFDPTTGGGVEAPSSITSAQASA